jgi:hypothetical protein
MAPSRIAPADLEIQPQRHLHLPRATDGFIHYAQTRRHVIEAAEGHIAAVRRQRRCPCDGELIVELVLRNVVDGDIEAGGIREVVNVEAVFKPGSLLLNNGSAQNASMRLRNRGFRAAKTQPKDFTRTVSIPADRGLLRGELAPSKPIGPHQRTALRQSRTSVRQWAAHRTRTN